MATEKFIRFGLFYELMLAIKALITLNDKGINLPLEKIKMKIDMRSA